MMNQTFGMVSHPCVQTFTARTAGKDELNSRDAIINGQWCVFWK